MVLQSNNFFFLAVSTLVYTTVCMETDIFVPAFPDMKLFFLTTDEAIQRVLSINFLGICLGSLVSGPVSDSYGRRKTLLWGLTLFVVASWGCLLFTNFKLFLTCRFIQGLGAATPMVIVFAMMLEKFPPERVAQICGAMNLFITGTMAAAPILGAFLNLYFGWQANFMLLAILASLSFVGSYIYIEETLVPEQRTTWSLLQVMKDYGTVLTSFPYMAAACVCYFLFAGMIMFVANQSLIFIEHLGVSKAAYGVYQASLAGSFALFSVLSIGIIERYGTAKTKYTGLIASVIGAILLLAMALIDVGPLLMCGAMVIFTAGVALSCPIYGMESANVFPQMRGIATGMSNALRLIMVAGIVGIGSFSFTGSIQPVAKLVAIVTAGAIILALALLNRKAVVLAS